MKTQDYFNFTGKTAVVTGGRRGLGKAMAVALAEHGANVAVIAQSPDAGEVADIIGKLGRGFLYLRADMAKREERAGLLEKVRARFGSVDILINCAGYLYGAPVLDYPLDQWDKDMAVLLDATFDLSQQAGRIMKEQGGGKIIEIASTAAFQEGVGLIAYATAKSAVIAMTRNLAAGLAPYKINVNAIAPGIFDTDINTGLFSDPQALAARCKPIPSGRLGEPEDIIGPMLFLAGEQSHHVYGQTIVVDGGFTLK